MIFPEIEKSYLQHLSEAKERAFARWRASGYADLLAHAEFIRIYKQMNARLAKRREG